MSNLDNVSGQYHHMVRQDWETLCKEVIRRQHSTSKPPSKADIRKLVSTLNKTLNDLPL